VTKGKEEDGKGRENFGSSRQEKNPQRKSERKKVSTRFDPGGKGSKGSWGERTLRGEDGNKSFRKRKLGPTLPGTGKRKRLGGGGVKTSSESRRPVETTDKNSKNCLRNLFNLPTKLEKH